MKNPFEKPAGKDEERIKDYLERMKKADHIGLFKVFLKEFQEAGGELVGTEIDSLRKDVLERHIGRIEQMIKNYEGVKPQPEMKEVYEERLGKMKKELARLKEEYENFEKK